MKKIYLLPVAAFLFVLVGMVDVAKAAPSETVAVSANVLATCNFTSGPGALAFGDYDPTSGAVDIASASLIFRCVTGLAYSIANDDGLNETGPGAPRMFNGGASYLPYTMVVTDMSATPGTGVGAATAVTLDIDGTIAAYQTAAAGAHTDTVTFTITF